MLSLQDNSKDSLKVKLTNTLKKTDAIFVTGHSGLLGSAVVAEFKQQGYTQVITAPRSDLDLTHQQDTLAFFRQHKPKAVIHCAALVGGMQANAQRPAEFATQNLQMQNHVIHGAHLHQVENLIFIGSNCMYPTASPQPLRESELMQGPMETSSVAYGAAKVAGVVQTDSYRKQYGRRYFSVVPCSLYGPNDCFAPDQSHVTPALILKFHLAKLNGANTIDIWGSGKPRRELMHAQDAARGIVLLFEKYDANLGTINLGAGADLTVREIAETIQSVVGFTGALKFDTSRPDGNMQKLLDSTRAQALGFHSSIALEHGLKQTYQWLLSADSVRGLSRAQIHGSKSEISRGD